MTTPNTTAEKAQFSLEALKKWIGDGFATLTQIIDNFVVSSNKLQRVLRQNKDVFRWNGGVVNLHQ